jgi:hypothetical protein
MNASFSPTVPNLQIAWDSTSYNAYEKCETFYYYSIVRGITPISRSIDLEFGILMHSTFELYHKRRSQGCSHDHCLNDAVDYILRSTWDSSRGRVAEIWSLDPAKNRVSALRTAIWTLDRRAEQGDPLRTYHLRDGRPAVELKFRFDTQLRTTGGEVISLCGQLDRLVEFGSGVYDVDVKTTKSELDSKYFAQFTPNNQISIYDLATSVIVADAAPAAGIIIDAIQVGVTFSRNQRQLVPRTPQQRTEWLDEFADRIQAAERNAIDGYWPHRRTSCFRCDFKDICSRDSESRETWLKQGFTQRVWDPISRRQDI